MIIYACILFAFTALVVCQNPSPCPDVFQYEDNSRENDKWYGVIQIRSSDDLIGIFVHIILDRPAELLGNWFGESISHDNMEFVVRNPKYRLEAGPPVSLRFFVKYNAAQTVPSLDSIRLNGKTICSSESKHEIRPTAPTLHISQNKPMFSNNNNNNNNNQQSRPSQPSNNNNNNQQSKPSPSSNNNNNNNQHNKPATLNNGNSRPSNGNSGTSRPSTNNNNNRTPSRPSNNVRPTERPTERPGTFRTSTEDDYHNSGNNNRPSSGSNSFVFEDKDSDSDEFFPGDFANLDAQSKPRPARPQQTSRTPGCGMVATRASPLVAHGQDTSPGQWPWHAALYHSKGIQLMYTCGATLISDRHVLTAAHCVTKPRTTKTVTPGNILVYLGKYNLVTFGPEVQDRDVSEIFVHPDYNSSVYFNDIAVLKLSRPVELTNFVRPCCLWDEESDLEEVIGKQGVVVGWGFDEHKKLSNKLMQAPMPIVSTVKCIYSNRDFFSRFTFEKNYCAGFKNGTSVCNGDSGGGMVLPKKGTSGQNTVWQIRGLVSVGVALQGEGICDTSQYIVFTDVAKHTHWIRQVLSD